ncbi:MAG: hypothetical protein AAB536_01380 [Patescibacteria group bacterium]
MDQKIVERIGWFASMMAIAMYFSFIDQIRLNLSGHPGSLILPIIAAINGAAWTTYGSFLEKKSWPIIVCNVPAVVLGIITAFTAAI